MKLENSGYSLTGQGVDTGDALLAAGANTALQIPLEAFAFSRLLRLFRRGAAGAAGSIAGQTADALATNVVTEAAQSIPEEITNKLALGEEVTAKDLLASLGQGAYEGLTMAPYALLGGGVALARRRNEEFAAKDWARRQTEFYDRVQELMPERGQSPAMFEDFITRSIPEMGMPVFIPADAVNQAGRRVAGLVEALGLDADEINADRVQAVPAAWLFSRLDKAQFDALIPEIRRGQFDFSSNEAVLNTKNALKEVESVAEGEAVVSEAADVNAATAQLREEIREAAANIEEPSAIGPVRVSPQVLATYLQSAPPEARAAFLNGLGVTEEELAGGTEDFFLELDNAIPHINQNPLFDGFVDLVEVESADERAARDAALQEIGAPPDIVENRASGLNNRIRGELEKEMRAAGRTAAEAKREVEVLARLSSTIAQITGQEDAGELARKTVRFKKAQAATGGARLNQAAMPDAVGAIDQETASMIGLPKAGALRLTDGDLAAIEQRHGQQFKQVGFADGREFIGYVLSHVDAVYKGRGNAYSFVSRGDNKDGRVFAEFEVVEENGSYRITTAHPVRESFFKKEIPLWDRSHAHPSTEADPIIAVDQGGAELQLNLTATPPKVKSTFEQGPRGFMEALSDGSFNIVLTEAQDASTVVHEFAHLFREMAQNTLALPEEQIEDRPALERLAAGMADIEAWLSRFDNEATLKAEYDKYQKANYGGREFGELNADEKATVLNTAKHEYFARGFEAYLMEGKAPSQGLKAIFKKMKELLLEIYRSISLDVEINDDVRRFFDSILASDEEIVANSFRSEGSFTVEEENALKAVAPEEFERVSQAHARAAEEAEKLITEARVKERMKALRQWRREGKAEADNDTRWTRIDDIVKRGGISEESLEAGGYDAEMFRQLRGVARGLVTKGGPLEYDVLADEFGFTDGDSFIISILDTPAKQAISDAYVAEQEALHEEYYGLDAGISDAEIKAKADELKLWSKYMGEEYRPGSLEALRASIRNEADKLSIDELVRLNQKEWKEKLRVLEREIRGTERRRGPELKAATLEGYRARGKEAKQELMEQRLELTMRFQEQARRAREIAKFEAEAKRLARQKAAGSYKHGGILPNFHAHIKNILAAAGIGQPAETTEPLGEFVTALAENGEAVAVPEEIISGAIWQKEGASGNIRRRRLRSLDYEEFEALRDTIQNLTHLGRRAQQVRVDGILQNEDTAAGAFISSVMERHDVAPEKSEKEVWEGRYTTGAINKARAAWKQWRKRGTGLLPETLKFLHMAFALDGQKHGGKAMATFYHPIDTAANKEILLREKFNGRLKEIIESTVGQKEFNSWFSQKILIDGYDRPFMMSEIISMGLNRGNVKNMAALKNHRAFGEKGFEPILARLKSKEWDFVQAVWDFMDAEVYPELNALELRTKGIPLKKEGAQPFTITTADGVVKTMRGGYYPLVFDPEGGNKRIQEKQERGADILNRPALLNVRNIQARATISRKGSNYDGLYPWLDLGVMMNSLNDNITDLAYREAVADVWRLFRREDVKNTINGVLGEDAWQQGKLWIYNLSVAGKQSNVQLPRGARAVLALRRNVARAAMAIKASVIALQFTGAFQSAQILGYGWTRKGFAGLYAHNPAEYKRIVDELYEKSPQLKYRNAQSYDRDIVAAMKSGKNPFYAKGMERATEIMFKPIGWADQVVVNGVWYGAYQKALHEGKTEQAAIQEADDTISLTQAMSQNKDMSYAQQGFGIGEWGKLLTMFQTFFSSTRNLQWLAARQAGQEVREGKHGKAAVTASLAALNLLLIQSFFSSLMWNGTPDDDEDFDEWATNLAKKTVLGSFTSGFAGIPGLRELSSAVASGLDDSGYRPNFAISPTEGAVNSLMRLPGVIERTAEGRLTPLKGSIQALRAGGPALGIPGASQMATTLEGVDEWDDNDGFGKVYRLFIRDPEGK